MKGVRGKMGPFDPSTLRPFDKLRASKHRASKLRAGMEEGRRKKQEVRWEMGDGRWKRSI
jgi:hypothetical protein